ncbi:MAG TPA: patatin-like phospholipase family protein, partial [Gemmataceae bacterium]
MTHPTERPRGARAFPHGPLWQLLRFYRLTFLPGFCMTVMLPLVALLMLGLTFQRFGISYGTPDLVYHDDPGKQFWVGFYFLLVFAQCLFVGYLLQTRPGNERLRAGTPFGARSFLGYALGVTLCFALTLLVIDLVGAGVEALATYFPAGDGGWSEDVPWPFLRGAGLALAIVVGLSLAVEHLPHVARPFYHVGRLIFWPFTNRDGSRRPYRPGGFRPNTPHEGDYASHGFAAVALVAMLVIFLIFSRESSESFSPMIGLCFLLYVALAVFGAVTFFWSRSLPLIAIVLVGLLMVAGGNPYRYRFPALDEAGYYDNPVDLAKFDFENGIRRDSGDTPGFERDSEPAAQRMMPAAPPAEDAAADDPKLLEVGDVKFLGRASGPYRAGEKKPLVVIAVSGGGMQAGAWVLALLQRLEYEFARMEPPVEFPYHVRLITGASGGMYGAAYYVVRLPAPGGKLGPARMAAMRGHYAQLTEDCLTPLVRQMAFRDLMGFFSPWSYRRDRGQALENAWKRNLRTDEEKANNRPSPIGLTFDDLHEREVAGWCPSLVFTPMCVEGGRRLLISNLRLQLVASNDGNLISEKTYPSGEPMRTFSHDAYEFFRLFPRARDRFEVATAVRMSATFPYISPAVSLPTVPRRRVVDAGYYDNYGVSLAGAWLFSGAHQEWLEKNVSKVLLIQIRSGPYERERLTAGLPADRSTRLSRGVEELTSPLEGLFNARVSSSSFRNDGLLEVLTQRFNEQRLRRAKLPAAAAAAAGQRSSYFAIATFEYDDEGTLSWYLPQDELLRIYNTAWSRPPDTPLDADVPPDPNDPISQRIRHIK